MSRFVNREVKRLDLGGGDWVDLATRLTFLDRRKIERALIGDPEKGSSEMDLVGANMKLLELAIEAWGGPGFCTQEHPHDGDCTPRPITRDAIAQLDQTGEGILLELQDRMTQPTPDFTQPPAPPSSTAGVAESTQPDS